MADEALTRILYVEDDADIRSVASFALEAVGGFVLAACASGEEALAQAAAFAPQLLLLDVMMPGMDGPETLAALRARPETAATPAVFMTAKVQPQEVARYRALGALDVISKPFDPMTLSDEIRALWARRGG
ncbi:MULTISPECIES: response regulator [Inquilinus]|uniref:CheY-like chemotaxis protein n=1 Tax=Inquilinus ginsengisoli TaxID=363840 RepID=A0ABU1JYQ0_9PROT|nr:response regulator [Inquilinus ginsengisoli]MDR6293750.1 CheY-like chemotaxis protein [Inquilinus ginsengisoli]